MGRGLSGALASHAGYSAIAGAGIGWWIEHRGRGLGVQLPRAVLLIGLAFFTHGIWDFFVVTVGRWTLRQERPCVTCLP